jgi:hypothetical protein
MKHEITIDLVAVQPDSVLEALRAIFPSINADEGVKAGVKFAIIGDQADADDIVERIERRLSLQRGVSSTITRKTKHAVAIAEEAKDWSLSPMGRASSGPPPRPSLPPSDNYPDGEDDDDR